MPRTTYHTLHPEYYILCTRYCILNIAHHVVYTRYHILHTIYHVSAMFWAPLGPTVHSQGTGADHEAAHSLGACAAGGQLVDGRADPGRASKAIWQGVDSMEHIIFHKYVHI